MNENKSCSLYLGVHVAETVLSKVFDNAERMPNGNKGFDFICNKGKKIDVKSACIGKNGNWQFFINKNMIADYFLCIAFDSRETLNPIHLWLIPSEEVCNMTSISVRPSTIDKFEGYSMDINDVCVACNDIRAH